MDPTTRFSLSMNEAAQHQRAGRLLASEAAREFAEAERKRAESHGRFSIVRAIKCGATIGLVDGFERELSEEEARHRGVTHDPHRFFVPFSALRTLSVGTATQAGYLVGTDNRAAVEALFPASTIVRLGAQVVDGLKADVTMPTISTAGSAQWLSELGTATSGAPTLDQLSYAPIAAVGYVEVSRQLSIQSAAERMVGNHLLRVVGNLIDYAAIQGNGTGQPLGVIGSTGVDLQSGTNFSNATAQTMLKAVADANVDDAQVRMLADPAARETLAQRCVIGTSAAPMIWQDNAVAGKPAFVSSNLPADTLIVGDFTQLGVLLWGNSLRIEVDPYRQFRAGIYGLRVIADCNVAVFQPRAFSVATSVS